MDFSKNKIIEDGFLGSDVSIYLNGYIVMTCLTYIYILLNLYFAEGNMIENKLKLQLSLAMKNQNNLSFFSSKLCYSDDYSQYIYQNKRNLFLDPRSKVCQFFLNFT